MDELRVRRWPHSREPVEAELVEIYVVEGMRPYRWSNGPRDRYAVHSHDYHKVIFVLSGSITFGLPQRREFILLKPGDRLDLPAGTEHEAVVGPDGVVCLEGHQGQ